MQEFGSEIEIPKEVFLSITATNTSLVVFFFAPFLVIVSSVFSLLSVLFFLMFRLLTRMHHALLNDTNYKGICLNWQIFVRLQHDSAWPRKTMFRNVFFSAALGNFILVLAHWKCTHHI
ncbi:hypothetical protein ACOSP7_010934 [Xanthoceras sorbifolium]